MAFGTAESWIDPGPSYVMPTPEYRSKLLPARGTKAALEASLPDLLDGEMTYATDEARYYQVEDGALVAVGGASGSGTTTTADVETTDPVLRMREASDLKTQQDVNWFIESEISDIKEDVGMLLNDYTTTDDFNHLNGKVKKNTEDIESLQECVEALPDADEFNSYAKRGYVDAQDADLRTEIGWNTGAISEQGKTIEANDAKISANTGKIAEAATKEELQSEHDAWTLADQKIQEAYLKSDEALANLIQANTEAIEGIETPEGAGPDPRLPYEFVVGEQDSNDLLVSNDAPGGVGEMQILETLKLQDGEGTICGGVAFESGGGIGIALSQRYDNTILIQGSELEKGVNANSEAIAANAKAIQGLESGDGPDLSSYALKSELPTDNADLANGAGYITAADVPEVPEAPSLDGYATETWVGEQGYLTEVPEDSRLPYALEQGEMLGSERGIKEDAPPEEMDEATDQTLETLTLRDAEGNAMGDVAFECANGIGVRWSTLYEGSLRISGENLQREFRESEDALNEKIKANSEAIQGLEAPEVEPDPRLPYRLGTDKAARSGEAAIELVDAEDNYSNVKFHGLNGIQCTSTIEGVNIDASDLSGRVKALEEAPAPSAQIDWNNLPNLTV